MATDDDRFFSLLVGRLGARRAELTERILAEVRAHPGLQTPRQLDRPQLRDHLPALLERLGAYLQGKPPEEACPPAVALADEHGHQRWEQRYRLEELVRELGVAERVLLREVLDPAVAGGEAPGPEAASLGRERIGRFFEDVVAASAERFARDAGRSVEDAHQRLRETSASRLALLQAVTH